MCTSQKPKDLRPRAGMSDWEKCPTPSAQTNLKQFNSSLRSPVTVYTISAAALVLRDKNRMSFLSANSRFTLKCSHSAESKKPSVSQKHVCVSEGSSRNERLQGGKCGNITSCVCLYARLLLTLL